MNIIMDEAWIHENHARSAKIKLSYRYLSFPIYYGLTNKIYRNGLTIKIGYSPEFIYYDYIKLNVGGKNIERNNFYAENSNLIFYAIDFGNWSIVSRQSVVNDTYFSSSELDFEKELPEYGEHSQLHIQHSSLKIYYVWTW